VSVGWRCTWFFASPRCLRILCSAILTTKVSGRVVMMKHSQVSFHRRNHLSLQTKINTQLLLISDLSARCLHQELRFVYCSAQNLSFGHFRHIQDQAHVGLFLLNRPPCPAIVAGMVKTYKKSVARCNYEIWQLPQPYTPP